MFIEFRLTVYKEFVKYSSFSLNSIIIIKCFKLLEPRLMGIY